MAAGNQVLPKQSETGTLAGAYQNCLWLTGEHASVGGSTGSEWTVVECDDGSRRDTPSPTAKFTDINSANDWSTGNANTPGVGSWVILESANKNNTNHLQIYIRLTSATQTQFRIIPLEDWASSPDFGSSTSTGGAEPDFGTVINYGNTSGTNTSITGFAGVAAYSNICDEGMFVWFYDDGTNNVTWLYAGEVNPFHPNASTTDDRAYVIFNGLGETSWEDSVTGIDWRRLSPVDKTTVLLLGSPGFIRTDGVSTSHAEVATKRGNVLGADFILPVPIYFDDVGHQHFAGWLRNCFMVHAQLGAEGTLGLVNPDFYYRGDATTTEPPICVTWDGSTVV